MQGPGTGAYKLVSPHPHLASDVCMSQRQKLRLRWARTLLARGVLGLFPMGVHAVSLSTLVAGSSCPAFEPTLQDRTALAERYQGPTPFQEAGADLHKDSREAGQQ